MAVHHQLRQTELTDFFFTDNTGPSEKPRQPSFPPAAPRVITSTKMLRLYRYLKGVPFHGYCNGIHQLHRKEWLLIDLRDEQFEAQLKPIQRKGAGRFWKGITGPEDGYKYDSYTLYIEVPPQPLLGRQRGRPLTVGSKHTFRIVSAKDFPIIEKRRKYSSKLGVLLKVETCKRGCTVKY